MILVVFFHARTGLLPGGYVGVDIFLVISGFLISRLLLRQMDARDFSMSVFYRRRVRRLIPALVVMVVVSLVAAFFVLGPRDLEIMAGASLAVLLLGSNFYFWRRTDYFAAHTPEPPLLHTWSLALEEQFYLLYPGCLWLIRHASPQLRLLVFATGTSALFAFNVWLTAGHPGTAFYLLPARAWEFSFGGLIALLTDRFIVQPRARELLVAAGLSGVILSAVCITRATPYPGLAVLLPAVSTGCILWGNRGEGTRAGRLLEWPAMVAIGAASYSVYLWHWPVLTLARYYVGRNLHPLETLVALVGVALLATLSWRYVERPYRLKGRPITAPRPLTAIGASALLIVLLSVSILWARGFPQRLPPSALAFERQGLQYSASSWKCHYSAPQRVELSDLCVLSHPAVIRRRILLWGDSHANAIAPAMAALGATYGAKVWQASYSSCPPVLGTGVARRIESDHCTEFNETVARGIRELGIQSVVLAAYWSSYTPDRSNSVVFGILDPYDRSSDILGGTQADDVQNLSRGLSATVNRIRDLGAEVWIIEQVPSQDRYVPLALSRAALHGESYSSLGITRDEYERSQAVVEELFAQLPHEVHLVSPAAELCQSGRCLMSQGPRSLYLDDNHLSSWGARLIEPALQPIFTP